MSFTNADHVLLKLAGYTLRDDGEWNDPLAGHPVPEATALRRAREDATSKPTLADVPLRVLAMASAINTAQAGPIALCIDGWSVGLPMFSGARAARHFERDADRAKVSTSLGEVVREIERRSAQKEPAVPATDFDLLAKAGYSPLPNGAWRSPTTGQLMSKEAALRQAREEPGAPESHPPTDLTEAARAFVLALDVGSLPGMSPATLDAWEVFCLALDRAEAQAQRAAPASPSSVLDEIEAAYRALYPDAELVEIHVRAEQQGAGGKLGYVASTCAADLADDRHDHEESEWMPTRSEALAALLALLHETIVAEERATTERAAALAAFRAGRK